MAGRAGGQCVAFLAGRTAQGYLGRRTTPEQMTMAEPKTHTGGCHCGHVRYQVTTDLSQVIACNCSICSKRGLLLTFVSPEQFSLRSNGATLCDYQFHKHVIHHRFCPVCGVESFAEGLTPDGRKMVAVNVRCLDNVDLAALTPLPFDGKSL